MSFRLRKKYTEENCCICLNKLTNFYFLKYTLHCGHTFHYKCIHELFRRSKRPRCPMCRQYIKRTSIKKHIFGYLFPKKADIEELDFNLEIIFE